MKQCPKCQVPLTVVKSGERQLDACPDCGGMWFLGADFYSLAREAPQELARLVGLVAPRQIPLADGPGSCPLCGQPLVEFQHPDLPGTALDGCRVCKGIWFDRSDLARLAEKLTKAAPVAPAETAAAGAEPTDDDARIAEVRAERKRREDLLTRPLRDRFGEGGPGLKLLALPLALVSTQILYWLVLPRILLDWFSVTLHELGHALIFWLSARAATPISCGPAAGWTSGNLEPSAFVFICFAFLVGVIGFNGFRHKTWGLVALAAALYAGQITFTFLLDDFDFQAVMIYSGIGGELILGTLCVVAFYYRLPDSVRWDFFRYPFLVLGMYAFGRAALLWYRVESGLASIPYGSFLGKDDAGGDMNRLRAVHGWSPEFITGLYTTTALVCLLVILVHYFFFTVRARAVPAGDLERAE